MPRYYFYLDSTPSYVCNVFLFGVELADDVPPRLGRVTGIAGTPTSRCCTSTPWMATNGYPYEDLVRTNAERTRMDPEYELIDAMGETFAKGHYWDVTFECTMRRH